MSSDFSLRELVQNALKDDLKSFVTITDSPKVLICCPRTLDILNSLLEYVEILDLGIRSVEGLFHSRTADVTKGAIYFCYPDIAAMERFIQDFGENPLYGQALFMSPVQTNNSFIEMIAFMTFLVSFIDEAFDSRSFHFDCQDSIKTFFLSHGLEELDKELDSASEKVLLFNELIAVLCKLKQFPIIKYFDPTKTGTNVAARFAWKLLVKAQGLIEERESWPKQNQDVDVIIMDRNHDSITPLIHSLCYRSAIHDLLTVKDGNKVFLLPGDEKPFVLDESDPYFIQLRHMYLDVVGPKIQEFIDENPAASAFHGKSTAMTTDDIKDQIYSVMDANKIIDHKTLFLALVGIYEKGGLDVATDFEQILATEEHSTREKITSKIIEEVENALENAFIADMDKLRLLLLCQLRFPHIELKSVADRILGALGLDALDGQNSLLGGQPIAKDESDPEWRFTHLGWRKALLEAGKSLPNFDPDDFLNRYEPTVSRILEEFIDFGTKHFYSVTPEPDLEQNVIDQKPRGKGLIIPFTTGFQPNWGCLVPVDPNYKEVVNYYENGRRIVLFMLGGMTLSEVQAVHQMSEKCKRDIIIGSTNLLVPSDYVTQLCHIGESHLKRRNLPSAIPFIEQELAKTNEKQIEMDRKIQEEKDRELKRMEEHRNKELAMIEQQKAEKSKLEEQKRLMLDTSKASMIEKAFMDVDVKEPQRTSVSEGVHIPKSFLATPGSRSSFSIPAKSPERNSVTSEPPHTQSLDRNTTIGSKTHAGKVIEAHGLETVSMPRVASPRDSVPEKTSKPADLQIQSPVSPVTELTARLDSIPTNVPTHFNISSDRSKSMEVASPSHSPPVVVAKNIARSQRTLRIANDEDDSIPAWELNATNRYTPEEAIQSSISGRKIYVINQDEDVLKEEEDKENQEPSQPQLLFQPPHMKRHAPGTAGLAAAARFRELANMSGYHDEVEDGVASMQHSSPELQVNSPPMNDYSSDSASGPRGGYIIPPRRNIPSNAVRIPNSPGIPTPRQEFPSRQGSSSSHQSGGSGGHIQSPVSEQALNYAPPDPSKLSYQSFSAPPQSIQSVSSSGSNPGTPTIGQPVYIQRPASYYPAQNVYRVPIPVQGQPFIPQDGRPVLIQRPILVPVGNFVGAQGVPQQMMQQGNVMYQGVMRSNSQPIQNMYSNYQGRPVQIQGQYMQQMQGQPMGQHMQGQQMLQQMQGQPMQGRPMHQPMQGQPLHYGAVPPALAGRPLSYVRPPLQGRPIGRPGQPYPDPNNGYYNTYTYPGNGRQNTQ